MSKENLKPEESAKRNLLKSSKPYVYEKIMKYDEKVKKGESIAILQFQYDYACNFKCRALLYNRPSEKAKTEMLYDR